MYWDQKVWVQKFGFRDFVRKNFTKFSREVEDDSEAWLKEVLANFECLDIAESQWLMFLPSLLTSSAHIWYSTEKSALSDFDEFIVKFSKQFAFKRDRPSRFRLSATTSTSTMTVPPSAITIPDPVSRTDPIQLGLKKH
ncbi:unnamed protein product [Didymodactylos carnosus]|uniref:Uncharacterized protein n=1 Tax=Didymodactylos carnosus TaxID=1234261 RepID=A0A815SYP8_9BILA|nr:unnamed protein product [Didymodactylos carnosus]CAF4359421.1 unnamed protein product [Didymodactylos carnosus]